MPSPGLPQIMMPVDRYHMVRLANDTRRACTSLGRVAWVLPVADACHSGRPAGRASSSHGVSHHAGWLSRPGTALPSRTRAGSKSIMVYPARRFIRIARNEAAAHTLRSRAPTDSMKAVRCLKLLDRDEVMIMAAGRRADAKLMPTANTNVRRN